MAITLSAAKETLVAHDVQLTRRDYIDSKVDHFTYYRQFVTRGLINTILRGFGRDCILASKDEHFNDIPLQRWVALAPTVPTRLVSLANMFTQAESCAVPSVSLSDQVCILKAAARVIRDESLTEHTVWFYAMGERFKVRAVFIETDDSNNYMRANSDTALIAIVDGYQIIANIEGEKAGNR